MMLRLAIIFGVIILVIAVVTYNYHARQKKYIRIVSPITEHPDLIGDGAWITQSAKYPDRFIGHREIEPRGM